MYQLEFTPNIFHSLQEISDYLSNLSPRYLYLYQQAIIYHNYYAFCYILIVYKSPNYFIYYKKIRNPR